MQFTYTSVLFTPRKTLHRHFSIRPSTSYTHFVLCTSASGTEFQKATILVMGLERSYTDTNLAMRWLIHGVYWIVELIDSPYSCWFFPFSTILDNLFLNSYHEHLERGIKISKHTQRDLFRVLCLNSNIYQK